MLEPNFVNFLKKFNFKNFESNNIQMFVDNQSAINLAKNAEYHKRSKHIKFAFNMLNLKIKKLIF